jgi:hypothetical protein
MSHPLISMRRLTALILFVIVSTPCPLTMPIIPMKRGMLTAAPMVWSRKNLIRVFFMLRTCLVSRVVVFSVLFGTSTVLGTWLGKEASSKSCQ